MEIDLSEMYCDVMEMMESGQDRRRRRRKRKREEMVEPWCCARLGSKGNGSALLGEFEGLVCPSSKDWFVLLRKVKVCKRVEG